MQHIINGVTFKGRYLDNIHDLFDHIDETISAYINSVKPTPNERKQLHEMLAEHHDHLADIITDDGTYQGGSGVPPLNDQSDQSNLSDSHVAVLDCTTDTVHVQVRVSPCLSVQVRNCDSQEASNQC